MSITSREPVFLCIVKDKSVWSNDGLIFGKRDSIFWHTWSTFSAFDFGSFNKPVSSSCPQGYIIQLLKLNKSLLISYFVEMMSSGVGGQGFPLRVHLIEVFIIFSIFLIVKKLLFFTLSFISMLLTKLDIFLVDLISLYMFFKFLAEYTSPRMTQFDQTRCKLLHHCPQNISFYLLDFSFSNLYFGMPDNMIYDRPRQQR